MAKKMIFFGRNAASLSVFTKTRKNLPEGGAPQDSTRKSMLPFGGRDLLHGLSHPFCTAMTPPVRMQKRAGVLFPVLFSTEYQNSNRQKPDFFLNLIESAKGLDLSVPPLRMSIHVIRKPGELLPGTLRTYGHLTHVSDKKQDILIFNQKITANRLHGMYFLCSYHTNETFVSVRRPLSRGVLRPSHFINFCIKKVCLISTCIASNRYH